MYICYKSPRTLQDVLGLPNCPYSARRVGLSELSLLCKTCWAFRTDPTYPARRVGHSNGSNQRTSTCLQWAHVELNCGCWSTSYSMRMNTVVLSRILLDSLELRGFAVWFFHLHFEIWHWKSIEGYVQLAYEFVRSHTTSEETFLGTPTWQRAKSCLTGGISPKARTHTNVTLWHA